MWESLIPLGISVVTNMLGGNKDQKSQGQSTPMSNSVPMNLVGEDAYNNYMKNAQSQGNNV